MSSWLRKYCLSEDGTVCVFKEEEFVCSDDMWFEKRPLCAPKKQSVTVINTNTVFTREYTGIGTNNFCPSDWVYYDESVKYFRYKSGGKYEVYDASNVSLRRNGFYSLIFDTTKLSTGSPNKKKAKKIEKFLTRMLADCVYYAKGGVKTKYDYDDFEKEYRAIWAVRDACKRIYKDGYKLNYSNLKKVLIDTSYEPRYKYNVYTFGRYVRDTAKELFDFLAETYGCMSEVDRSGTDEAGQDKGVLNA